MKQTKHGAAEEEFPEQEREHAPEWFQYMDEFEEMRPGILRLKLRQKMERAAIGYPAYYAGVRKKKRMQAEARRNPESQDPGSILKRARARAERQKQTGE